MSVNTFCAFYCVLVYLIRKKPLPLKIIFSPLSLDFCILEFLPCDHPKEGMSQLGELFVLMNLMLFCKVVKQSERESKGKEGGSFAAHHCFFLSSAVITATPVVNTWRFFPPVHLREISLGYSATERCAILPKENRCSRQDGNDGQHFQLIAVESSCGRAFHSPS